MTDGEWTSSHGAEMRLKNHCDDPRALLLNWLRAGSVTARAASIRQQGVVVERAPFSRDGGLLAARFWEALSQEDWRAGIFGSVEPAPSEHFEGGEALHWTVTGVEINWVEVVGHLGAGLDKAPSSKKTPANRKLDYDRIIRDVIAMRAVQPEISIGSAAASIVADLPPNPTNGKQRDQRHIERIIKPLWEGEVQQAPHKPHSPDPI